MIKKLTAVAGFGAGYVLGAKAGRERYRQIVAKVDQLRGIPQVQRATDAVSTAVVDKATELAESARSSVQDAVAGTVEKARAKASLSHQHDGVLDLHPHAVTPS